MSAIITGKVFWTLFKDLSYQDKNGKVVNIKETTAKIVMLSIADSADDYGENSWNSFETLAHKSSIERRSVIRVVRALIAKGYLKVAGISNYGTNNFSINLTILGNPPARRSKIGRPKTSDSEAEIGDSEAKTSDPQSPDPSYILPETTPATAIQKRGDLVDGYLAMMKAPGLKKSARIDAILSYLGGRLRVNTETKRWKEFAKFVDDRQQNFGESVEAFVAWLTGQKDFNIQFWSPQRMMEYYPQAFTSEQEPQPAYVQPFQFRDDSDAIPNPFPRKHVAA